MKIIYDVDKPTAFGDVPNGGVLRHGCHIFQKCDDQRVWNLEKLNLFPFSKDTLVTYYPDAKLWLHEAGKGESNAG